jgi:hypothetical protein
MVITIKHLVMMSSISGVYRSEAVFLQKKLSGQTPTATAHDFPFGYGVECRSGYHLTG